MGRRGALRKKLASLQSEKGYLMVSTLFLLVLSALLLQGIISISANYIIQLEQISSGYQAKTVLNMSERILKDYIVENNDEFPGKAEISSSIGTVRMLRVAENSYEATITQKDGMQFKKNIDLSIGKNAEEETAEMSEDCTDSQEQDSLKPIQEETIILD